ncbi:MAG: phosphoserine phosphatase SerB [Pseudomonadota bacterium]
MTYFVRVASPSALPRMTKAHAEQVIALFDGGANSENMRWLATDIAFEMTLTREPSEAIKQAVARWCETWGVDHMVGTLQPADIRLFMADMDSTMIENECIDELADMTGKGAHVAEITEAAMRGELDFEAALDERVALLTGLPEGDLARCYHERIRFTPGARTLVQTLHHAGVHCVLVSGGFRQFTSRVAAALGFHREIANQLVVADGSLAGRVERPLVDAPRKQQELIRTCEEISATPSQAVAIGDGANDIPMLQASALGLAYYGKEKTRRAADAVVQYGDLSTVLFLLGYPQSAWRG